MPKKVHEVVYIVAGVFKTACGLYLDGPDKERGEALLHKITCKNCQRVSKAHVRSCCFSSPWGLSRSSPHQKDCPEYREPIL